jgi:hypothetical protein
LPGSVTARSAASSSIPTFSIVSVEKDKTVTIKTYNFPANDSFTVTMGAYGTLGIGGVVVGTTSSGPGGTFTATYSIPASLAGSYRIAIRLQSYSSGYYAYNWFYNNTAAGSGSPGSGYSGYPTFAIVDVVRDSTVTIKTYNMPANDSFTVRMGAYGALGIGGVVVATTSSGAGGSFTATYNIPASLAGSYRIAIRMDSPTSGYYAYNWFYNNTVSAPPPGPTPTPGPTPAPGYSGYPTFSITAVVRDSTVTIQAYNLPPNDTFTVTMGPYGTLGIGGVVVTSTASGSGGSQSFTYNIPAALSGSYQIAIRLQSSTSGYYAYNWFYNNTTK